MKKLTTIISAIALGIALFQPMSAFADDKDKKENGQRGKGKKEKGKADNREQAAQQYRVSAPVARSRRDAVLSPNVNVQPSNAERSRARAVQNQTAFAPSSRYSGPTLRTSRSSGYSGYSDRGNNTYSNQNSYTRSNNYGGLWIQGDNHRDWNRTHIHVWNNRRYGWYDGGWLNLDGGYQPRGYAYSDYSGGSSVRQVQRRLSEKGYRLGYADGVIGPATRSAIAEYQQDNRLAVTGRINNSLLSSLGLR